MTYLRHFRLDLAELLHWGAVVAVVRPLERLHTDGLVHRPAAGLATHGHLDAADSALDFRDQLLAAYNVDWALVVHIDMGDRSGIDGKVVVDVRIGDRSMAIEVPMVDMPHMQHDRPEVGVLRKD